MPDNHSAESARIAADFTREKNWKRWGPYLPERHWGTVREDYSSNGNAWTYFPFEHASLRSYRWGADGLLGFTDREARFCFCPTLWNGKDPLIKERLFGLSSGEGNHGEDCKELYYYLDSTPTHSYNKALYKYPQNEYPYDELRNENAKRSLMDPEFELLDTQALQSNQYFDLVVEYAKASPNDILIQITAVNRNGEPAKLDLLPKLWFRNTWIWGCKHEGCTLKPKISLKEPGLLELRQDSLGPFYFAYEANEDSPLCRFTENETDTETLYQTETYTKHTGNAFNKWVVEGDDSAVTKDQGTMAMLRYSFELQGHESKTIRLRFFLEDESPSGKPFDDFDAILEKRIAEANAYWESMIPQTLTKEEQAIQRQAYAGLLWSKQFYHFSVADWLQGDSAVATPPSNRLQGRNHNWRHLFNRDVISMPDKWEYPWYASWDLAFHMIPFAQIDLDFAKQQLILFLREWYMHPNGQIPAYEWEFDDVNPPVHAWSCWQVYQIGCAQDEQDLDFLKRVFTKLLLNFTWWVNRKDISGNNIFGGGFLGLDNITLFDRSKPLPGGATIHQADGTAWMAFYSTSMLAISLELSCNDRSFSDIASKFFEHFMAIADAINHFGDRGLWDPETGFYYDEIQFKDGHTERIKVRSLVGLLPMIAVLAIDRELLDSLPGFSKRMKWYLEHRKDITSTIACLYECDETSNLLLALPSEDRLRSLLKYLFDENEFLSPYGIRSLSKYHEAHPYQLNLNGEAYEVHYCPGDSDTWLFGGNSNWRGPVWFPLNYLIIHSLKQYHKHFGNTLQVEYPTGSGKRMNLLDCAKDIERRLSRLFLKSEDGIRPYNATHPIQSQDPHFENLHQFFEYFHGDDGRGLGASHQTGWTALIATILSDLNGADSPTPDSQ